MQTSIIKNQKLQKFLKLAILVILVFSTFLYLYDKREGKESNQIKFDYYSVQIPTNYIAQKLTSDEIESITPYIEANRLKVAYSIKPIKKTPKTPDIDPIIIGQFRNKNDFLIKAQINTIKYDPSKNKYYVEISTDTEDKLKKYLKRLNKTTKEKQSIFYSNNEVGGSHFAYNLYILDSESPIFILIPAAKRIRCDLADGIDSNKSNSRLVNKCSKPYEALLTKYNPKNNKHNSYIYKEDFGIYNLGSEYWNTIYPPIFIDSLLQ